MEFTPPALILKSLGHEQPQGRVRVGARRLVKLFILASMAEHLLGMRRTNRTVSGILLYWNRLEAVSMDCLKKNRNFKCCSLKEWLSKQVCCFPY